MERSRTHFRSAASLPSEKDLCRCVSRLRGVSRADVSPGQRSICTRLALRACAPPRANGRRRLGRTRSRDRATDSGAARRRQQAEWLPGFTCTSAHACAYLASAAAAIMICWLAAILFARLRRRCRVSFSTSDDNGTLRAASLADITCLQTRRAVLESTWCKGLSRGSGASHRSLARRPVRSTARRSTAQRAPQFRYHRSQREFLTQVSSARSSAAMATTAATKRPRSQVVPAPVDSLDR